LAKSELDSRMLQEANERIMEAKTRVAQQKQRNETVKTFYPLKIMSYRPLCES
jgi:hypothetical protein